MRIKRGDRKGRKALVQEGLAADRPLEEIAAGICAIYPEILKDKVIKYVYFLAKQLGADPADIQSRQEKEEDQELEFSKANLLMVICRRKQTMRTLQRTFNYHLDMVDVIKELIAEGKIKAIEGYDDGTRLFFVKPDFDPAKLKRVTSVEKYIQKKEEFQAGTKEKE